MWMLLGAELSKHLEVDLWFSVVVVQGGTFQVLYFPFMAPREQVQRLPVLAYCVRAFDLGVYPVVSV